MRAALEKSSDREIRCRRSEDYDKVYVEESEPEKRFHMIQNAGPSGIYLVAATVVRITAHNLKNPIHGNLRFYLFGCDAQNDKYNA